MNKPIALFLLCSVLMFGLTACGGGGATSSTQVSTQTLGQELTDLKKAYDSGAMSEKEFESARKALLKKYK